MKRRRPVFAAALVIAGLVVVAPGLSARDHRFDARGVGRTSGARVAHPPPPARLLFAAAVVASDEPVGYRNTIPLQIAPFEGAIEFVHPTGSSRWRS